MPSTSPAPRPRREMSIQRRSRRRGLPMRCTGRTFFDRFSLGTSPIWLATDDKSSGRQPCRSSNATAIASAYRRVGMRCGSPISRTNASSMQSSSSNTSRSLRFQRSPAARFANTSSEADRDRSNESVLSARARRLSGTVGVTVIPILVTRAVSRRLHSVVQAGLLRIVHIDAHPWALVSWGDSFCVQIGRETADVDTVVSLI
jgi:hypothetical protein